MKNTTIGALALAALTLTACGGSDEPREVGDDVLTELEVTPEELVEIVEMMAPGSVSEVCRATEDMDLPTSFQVELFGPVLEEGAREWGFSGEEMVRAILESC